MVQLRDKKILRKPGNSMKGQSTEEFMVVLCLILMVFFIFYALYSMQVNITHVTSDTITESRIAAGTRAALDYLYLAGDGSRYNATFAFGVYKFNLSVREGAVSVGSENTAYTLPLLTKKVNFTALNEGQYTLVNSGGWLYVE